jgi:hypothetical protein
MASIRRNLVTKQSAAKFINEVLKLEEEEKIKVITLLWQWWNESNNIKEEGKV